MISISSALLGFICPVVSDLFIVQLKSPANNVAVRLFGMSGSKSFWKKISLSAFFSAPDGAYTFIICIPSIIPAIPLPLGRHITFSICISSLTNIAVPLLSVPILTCFFVITYLFYGFICHFL